MMGVTRVGIRDAYYVAMRERTRTFAAAASCALIHVPFNNTIDGSRTCEFSDSNRHFLTSVSI